MNTEALVRKILAEQLGQHEASFEPAQQLGEDLNADSLDLVELALAIEEEFGIDEVPDGDLEKVKTVSDLFDLVKSKVAA